jgi:hypothetical protein
MPDPDELTQKVARHLDVDWRYVEQVEAWDVDRIAEVRAAGRRAGRMLGYKVVTTQSHRAAREDGLVVVIVAGAGGAGRGGSPAYGGPLATPHRSCTR